MTTSTPLLLDTITILNHHEIGGREVEICATARAGYDSSSGEMEIELDAFLRQVMTGTDALSRPVWLPRPQTVRMKLDIHEASDAAKDVFKSWRQRIHAAIPPNAGDWL